MATLTFVTGPRKGQRLRLDTKQFIIGRGRDCMLSLDDSTVSSRHAALNIEDGKWVLLDLLSSNGTLVNGMGVQSRILESGDVIGVGDAKLRFDADGQRPATKRSEAASPPPDQGQGGEGGGEGKMDRATPAAAVEDDPPPTAEDEALVRAMSLRTETIRQEVAKVVVGQGSIVEQILTCVLCGGHALLIGLPGLAKTTIIRTVADVLDLQFKRIQFTPDLMPSDITGTEVLETNRDTNEKEFRFIRGPVFCSILLADEINRTPPKTQAALLEAMQEKSVTVGNLTYSIDEPFFVLATQNPIEQEGTYPLPEAQMDRFMFSIWIDYPEESEEELIGATTTRRRTVQTRKVLNREEILQLQDVVWKVPASRHVVKYATHLARASRPTDARAPAFIRQYVSTGAGPRATQYLILAAKARAVLEGRIHVGCGDVREAAAPVLRHRLFTNFVADSEEVTPNDLIARLVEAVPEPTEDDYPAR